MILLWGVPGDAPMDAVRMELQRLGAEARFLDQRQASTIHAAVTVDPDGNLIGKFVDAEGEIDLASVGATYIRPFETSKACGIVSPNDPLYQRAVAVDSALVTWADLSQTTVVNRPVAMASNNSKPYQLAMIARFGFAVPETLVTTDELAVIQFQKRHGSVIYKSVSGVRSIVSRLDKAKCDALTDVANCPTQFQEHIPGTDVRVHVVYDQIFATEITCTADDYRYASRMNASFAMKPVELPVDFVDKCCGLVRNMGLHLAGIDFRRTPKGIWYCFEVNPSPGFTFYEAATGQPIAATIANMLLRFDQSMS